MCKDTYPGGYIHEAKTVCATCGEDWLCHHEWTRTQIEALRNDLFELASDVTQDCAMPEAAAALLEKWDMQR